MLIDIIIDGLLMLEKPDLRHSWDTLNEMLKTINFSTTKQCAKDLTHPFYRHAPE